MSVDMRGLKFPRRVSLPLWALTALLLVMVVVGFLGAQWALMQNSTTPQATIRVGWVFWVIAYDGNTGGEFLGGSRNVEQILPNIEVSGGSQFGISIPLHANSNASGHWFNYLGFGEGEFASYEGFHILSWTPPYLKLNANQTFSIAISLKAPSVPPPDNQGDLVFVLIVY